jgi:hypothetical protein
MVRTLWALPILFPTIAFLSGCSTPAQDAANAQQEVDRMMVVYGPACEKLGYASNSDPWRNCVMQFSYRNEATRNNVYYGTTWVN